MFKLYLSKYWYLGLAGILSTAFVINHAVSDRPFHPNLECASCHLAGEGTTLQNASQLTFSQEALCGQCHRSALELSHPSGFKPNRKLPEVFPLDWKGDMTCSSCHNIHQLRSGLLRGDKTGKDLCLSCHEPAFFAQMADHGISLNRLGHLSASTKQMQRELDPYSIQCMGCHSDNGDGPTVNLDTGGVLRHTGGVNHPIGGNYDMASRSGLYKPASQLRAGIHLPQGKVSCVSCHAGYKKQHGKLVMENDRSALCLECHDL